VGGESQREGAKESFGEGARKGAGDVGDIRVAPLLAPGGARWPHSGSEF
jgi:hypothetical protein